MKKNLLKTFTGVMAIIAVTAGAVRADDRLYVYAPNGVTQSFAFDNLQKVTFTEQNINLHLAGNGVSALLYNNVSVVTFKMQGTDFVPETVPNLKVYLDGAGTVVIESPTEIATVHLYSMNGVLLQQFAPQSLTAHLSPAAYPAGLYIVRVMSGQGQISAHKIVKP